VTGVNSGNGFAIGDSTIDIVLVIIIVIFLIIVLSIIDPEG